jgi:tight adherence protein C
MIDHVAKSLSDPSFLVALLVAIAVFATAFTALPAFGGNPLKVRMKTVALEREELRAKQRARLQAEADRRRRGGLREEQSIGMRNIVDRLDLRRALVDQPMPVSTRRYSTFPIAPRSARPRSSLPGRMRST